MKLTNVAPLAEGDRELILISGYGRLEVGQAQAKLDEYLQELAKLSEQAKSDPYIYARINAVLRAGVVGALAEALGERFKDM